jgi:flagella basal body P-ring formation protein FlgA
MRMALHLLFAIALQGGPCLLVQDDRIYGRDIAVAVPGFAAFPDGFALGYAPAPGVRRVLQGTALQRVAKSQGIDLESVPDVCFERALGDLNAEAIHEAMRAAFEDESGASVQIDVENWGPQTAPLGKIVFPLTGIQAPGSTDPKSEVLWRGYSLYGSNHRFGIWARARLSAKVTRVVAAVDIEPGKPIQANQVRLESAEVFALDTRAMGRLDEAVGYSPRSLVLSGAPILRSQLSKVAEVIKGDLVRVQVTDGGAHLVLDARAEGSGTTGAKVWLKNLTSGKVFRGTVAGKGTVVVGEAAPLAGPVQ